MWVRFADLVPSSRPAAKFIKGPPGFSTLHRDVCVVLAAQIKREEGEDLDRREQQCAGFASRCLCSGTAPCHTSSVSSLGESTLRAATPLPANLNGLHVKRRFMPSGV